MSMGGRGRAFAADLKFAGDKAGASYYTGWVVSPLQEFRMPFADVVVCTKTPDVTGAVKTALEAGLPGVAIKTVEHNQVRLGFLKTPCIRYGAYVCENGGDAHILEVYGKAFHRQAWLEKWICIVSGDPAVQALAKKDGVPCFARPAEAASYLQAKNA